MREHGPGSPSPGTSSTLGQSRASGAGEVRSPSERATTERAVGTRVPSAWARSLSGP
jgi:hypothetical protein